MARTRIGADSSTGSSACIMCSQKERNQISRIVCGRWATPAGAGTQRTVLSVYVR